MYVRVMALLVLLAQVREAQEATARLLQGGMGLLVLLGVLRPGHMVLLPGSTAAQLLLQVRQEHAEAMEVVLQEEQGVVGVGMRGLMGQGLLLPVLALELAVLLLLLGGLHILQRGSMELCRRQVLLLRELEGSVSGVGLREGGVFVVTVYE
jgi:hypothetical protein